MSQHTFVLSRRVGRPLHLVERALTGMPSGDYSGLTFAGPFERRAIVGPWGSGPPEREAVAILRTGRRATARVVVELGPWARDVSELRIRPAAHHPDWWRGRRQTHYFDAAHDAIDTLAGVLEREVPATPARRPITRIA